MDSTSECVPADGKTSFSGIPESQFIDDVDAYMKVLSGAALAFVVFCFFHIRKKFHFQPTKCYHISVPCLKKLLLGTYKMLFSFRERRKLRQRSKLLTKCIKSTNSWKIHCWWGEDIVIVCLVIFICGNISRLTSSLSPSPIGSRQTISIVLQPQVF